VTTIVAKVGWSTSTTAVFAAVVTAVPSSKAGRTFTVCGPTFGAPLVPAAAVMVSMVTHSSPPAVRTRVPALMVPPACSPAFTVLPSGERPSASAMVPLVTLIVPVAGLVSYTASRPAVSTSAFTSIAVSAAVALMIVAISAGVTTCRLDTLPEPAVTPPVRNSAASAPAVTFSRSSAPPVPFCRPFTVTVPADWVATMAPTVLLMRLTTSAASWSDAAKVTVWTAFASILMVIFSPPTKPVATIGALPTRCASAAAIAVELAGPPWLLVTASCRPTVRL
jgi:hypothetical protein